MGILLPWLESQPDDNIPTNLWTDYHDTLAAIVLIAAIIFAAIIVVLYVLSVRGRLIRKPADPFMPFTPLRWLIAAVAPAVLVFAFALYQYGQRFPDAEAGFLGGSLSVGVVAGILTLILSYAFIPVLTPPKFKYRVRPF